VSLYHAIGMRMLCTPPAIPTAGGTINPPHKTQQTLPHLLAKNKWPNARLSECVSTCLSAYQVRLYALIFLNLCFVFDCCGSKEDGACYGACYRAIKIRVIMVRLQVIESNTPSPPERLCARLSLASTPVRCLNSAGN